MKNIPYLLGVAMLCVLASCQKEIDWRTPEKSPVDDGRVLSKYVELDTTLPSGKDTTNVYTFTYDNVHRIKRIYQVQSFNGIRTAEITTDFFYNGSETNPFKTIEVDKEAETYVDTSFYTYSNGFVRSDSSVFYSLTGNEFLFAYVISFSVNGNSVFVKFKQSTVASSYEDTATLTVTRQNGNIIKQQDADNTINYSMDAKYDNKINPFYAIDIHYPIIYEHLFNAFNAQKNNLIERTASTTLTGVESHLIYTYSYRNDGYPLTVNMQDLRRPNDNRKGLFFYTK